jgi:subtilisin-like proprotein convertase family protein
VVGIHHGSGDVKKISVDDDPVISSDDDRYWLVRWDDGTTEAGASGSAVFDANNKRILGQLSKGNAACDGNISNEGEEDFGKIYWSWDQIGPNSTEQLKPWLDPINSGVLVLDGNSCASAPTADINSVEGSDINLCGSGTIKFEDQSIGIPTSWLWTFSGAGVSPTSSTLQNPEITINSAGTLDATLMVSNAQGTDVINQSYPVTFYNCEQNTYCATPSLSIPDNNSNSVSSSITIPNSSTLIDIDIEVDVSHTYIADLVFKLEHAGTSINLLTRPNAPIGTCGEEDIQATFDDEATLEAQSMCETVSSAITGSVIPNFPLSTFNNIDPMGTWTISLADQASEDTGILNSWCIKATTSNSILPIELLEFSAVQIKGENKIELNWTTSSEVNNQYFIVEKSEDTQNWSEIGKVEGKGTIATPSSYKLIDHNPFLRVTNYYRLKQIDFDGYFSYSSIRSVYMTTSFEEEIAVYPNPILAGTELNFTNQDKIEKIKLFNLIGQEINIINSRIPRHLSEGVYILECTLKSGSKELKKLMVK